MTGIYVRVNDDTNINSGISWLGDNLEDRKMCSHCHCVKLVRENKKYYRCPQCNLRFDVAEEKEQVTIDRSVSLLDIPPVIKYMSNEAMTSRTLRNNHNELRKRYGIKTLEEEDLGLGDARIVQDYEL